jgi:serine/threonine-protein kinase
LPDARQRIARRIRTRHARIGKEPGNVDSGVFTWLVSASHFRYPQMSLQRLGPFELLRVLGRGGMGTVYEAREAGSTVHVAVKALAPQFSFDDRFRHRFEGEIDALMKLEHENIVRLLSYGQDEGNLFFAMELVDGNSLFQEQKKGQVFHWREIIDIGKQVCAGLRHAHDRGIIHRDLKPGNLMIDKSRRIKITDFGIAKSFGSSSLTREGNVLGTMDYMSPEQARGEAVTVRSDLFSLGAVLYALLSGRPPFLQESAEQTFEMLLSNRRPVQLDRIATDTPQPLASLIHRLLEKDPANRLATAMATSRQLQHVEDAIQPGNDCDTQVVKADEAAAAVEGGATFVTKARPLGVSQTSLAEDSLADETHVSEPAASIEGSMAKKPDYFNEVTPQQRSRSVSEKRDADRSNPWPLLAALATVLAIAAFGIWYSLIRTPGAEQLLEMIRAAERYPNRVKDEIRIFLENHPDHDEAGHIRELQKLGEAIAFRNTLELKQRHPKSQLTLLEQQFLDITGMKQADAPQALDKMKAFLAINGQGEPESGDDHRIIDAARIFLIRLEQDAQAYVRNNLANINDIMARAARIRNPEDALSAYRYVVDEYSEDEWASVQVEKARQEIKRIETGSVSGKDQQP